jgi:hypothetical protein
MACVTLCAPQACHLSAIDNILFDGSFKLFKQFLVWQWCLHTSHTNQLLVPDPSHPLWLACTSGCEGRSVRGVRGYTNSHECFGPIRSPLPESKNNPHHSAFSRRGLNLGVCCLGFINRCYGIICITAATRQLVIDGICMCLQITPWA